MEKAILGKDLLIKWFNRCGDRDVLVRAITDIFPLGIWRREHIEKDGVLKEIFAPNEIIPFIKLGLFDPQDIANIEKKHNMSD